MLEKVNYNRIGFYFVILYFFCVSVVLFYVFIKRFIVVFMCFIICLGGIILNFFVCGLFYNLF